MSELAAATTLILAGGLGTRLQSVVRDQPKVLAEIGGRPFLQYLLDQVISWGGTRVLLCTGYLGGQIEERFGPSYRGLQINYSREASSLGTGGALRLAAGLIQSDTVLVMNGDSYCDADAGDFCRAHRNWGAQATLLLGQKTDTKRFGTVQVDPQGRILRFEEKKADPGPGLVNAGLYLIETELLHRIPGNGAVSLEREVFPKWIGGRFFGHETSADFLDIGTPESYAVAETFLARLSERKGRVRGNVSQEA